MAKMKLCPFCGSRPWYDKDVKQWVCGSVHDLDNECPIGSVMMSAKEWNNRA